MHLPDEKHDNRKKGPHSEKARKESVQKPVLFDTHYTCSKVLKESVKKKVPDVAQQGAGADYNTHDTLASLPNHHLFGLLLPKAIVVRVLPR